MVKITRIDATKVSQPRKIRVAAYARVSTDSNEQLLSLEIQKTHYEEYIKSNPNWAFAGLYYDESISGTKIAKRNELLRLLDDCKAGKIDRIITKSISRFARNTTECLEMVRELSALKISIFFEKENIDTEHMGSELMLSILSSIAENESRSISENRKWGARARFEDGSYIMSYPPYGYKNVDGKLVIIPEEAEVVKEIFDMSLSGMGCPRIAAELNRRGIQSKHRGEWHPSTVQRMLKNEKYTGDAIFQKTYTDKSFNTHINYGEENMYLVKDHHEAIVSHEIFNKVASELKRRGSEKGMGEEIEKYQNRYCFTGKLICGECGSSFKRRIHCKPTGNYVAWSCKTHTRDKTICKMKFIRDEQIKKAFIRMVLKLHAGRYVVIKPFIAGLRKKGCSKEEMNRLTELQERIDKCSDQQKILTRLLSSGYIEPDVYFKEKHDLDVENIALEKEKEQLSSNLKGILQDENEAKKLMCAISKDISSEFDEKLFKEIVENVTIISREKIRFNLKCGLQLDERLVKV